jgi:hypothetical protein
MQQYLTVLVMMSLACGAFRPGLAEDAAPDDETIRNAVRRAIPLLEQGSAGSAEHRTCFTCHNQAVPVFALVEARRRGFSIDEENLERQFSHTAAHLKRGLENYREGRGQGGRVITAGYALWTLEAGDRPADEVTEAVTHFLLEYQKEAERWSHPGKRPPSSGSDFTASYVALRGLSYYGTQEQRERIDSRTARVAKWLSETTPQETEDHVFRLWALHLTGADAELVEQAVEELLKLQQADGGWGQNAPIPDVEAAEDASQRMMPSDAYATGTVLTVLLETGLKAPDSEPVRRGVRYLLKTQLEDGSWHVVTRAEGFQTYFESGFPHGQDQFISIAATGWAALGLLLALGE